MTKKLAACAAVLLLAGGCRMCSDCCDYGPVVPGGPPLGTTRSGSVLNGAGYAGGYVVEPAPMPAVAGEAIETAQPVIAYPPSVGG